MRPSRNEKLATDRRPRPRVNLDDSTDCALCLRQEEKFWAQIVAKVMLCCSQGPYSAGKEILQFLRQVVGEEQVSNERTAQDK